MVIVLVLMLAIPAVAVLLVSFLRALRKAVAGEALVVYFDPTNIDSDDSIFLELRAGPKMKKVTVARIILDREFAGSVLAQAPEGFRNRSPEPPPEYHSFEPDLDELRGKHSHITAGMIEREKRRQYADVMEAWKDLKTSVVIWEGRLTIRRGHPERLTVPMRTDVAATGRFTFIYSYRSGLFTTNGTAFADYRPRLVAVHG